MKMIWAVLRSESVQPVIDALRKAGISGLTRMDVAGESSCPALPEGAGPYAENFTGMIMFALPDNDVAKAVLAIRAAAKAHAKPDPGGVPDAGTGVNGRILVTYIEDFYTIRTALQHAGSQDHEEDHRDYPE